MLESKTNFANHCAVSGVKYRIVLRIDRSEAAGRLDADNSRHRAAGGSTRWLDCRKLRCQRAGKPIDLLRSLLPTRLHDINLISSALPSLVGLAASLTTRDQRLNHLRLNGICCWSKIADFFDRACIWRPRPPFGWLDWNFTEIFCNRIY